MVLASDTELGPFSSTGLSTTECPFPPCVLGPSPLSQGYINAWPGASLHRDAWALDFKAPLRAVGWGIRTWETLPFSSRPSCSWLLVGATQCQLDTQSVPVRPRPGAVYEAVLVRSRQDSDAHGNFTMQVLLLGSLQYWFSEHKTTKPLTSAVPLITYPPCAKAPFIQRTTKVQSVV